MIQKNFDIPFIADLALREKQIQQSYRPIIAVHKWFARRPGTLFRGLFLSEFTERPLCEAFRAHEFRGPPIADPFMGGGTPLLKRTASLPRDRLRHQPDVVLDCPPEIGILTFVSPTRRSNPCTEGSKTPSDIFTTRKCALCGKHAYVKYFLWVKVTSCPSVWEGTTFPRLPARRGRRHPQNVLVCADCGP